MYSIMQYWRSRSIRVWVKTLEDGCHAVLFLNGGAMPMSLSVTLETLGITAGGEYSIRDIWQHRTLDETVTTRLTAPGIGKHDCWFAKLTPLTARPSDEAVPIEMQ